MALLTSGSYSFLTKSAKLKRNKMFTFEVTRYSFLTKSAKLKLMIDYL